jgi:hypothetical protein
MSHVGDVRQAVRFAVMELKDTSKGSADLLLPGFCLPKGIQPILPIFRESILNGAPELKEQVAICSASVSGGQCYDLRRFSPICGKKIVFFS